jgi:hypothetical protein
MALQSFSGIYWRFSWGFREFVTVDNGKSVKDGLSIPLQPMVGLAQQRRIDVVQ